jgi:uncharacterized membrane protein YgcG
MRKLLRSFAVSTDGFVAAYFLVALLPALVAIGVVTIDITRGNSLQTDLQRTVDSLALAAAAELDGKTDAPTRAREAIKQVLVNGTRFSTTGRTVINQLSQVNIRFLKNLPADDETAIATTDVANEAVPADVTNIRWVEVRAVPQTYRTLFRFAGVTTPTVGAGAVAGRNDVVCDFTPMFICNPYETAPGGMTLETAALTPAQRRRLLQVRAQGQNGRVFPGVFGILESPSGGNTQAIREMFASTAPKACYNRRGVVLDSGRAGANIVNAINTRFDLYESGQFNKNGPYPPSVNVRKGMVPEGNYANPVDCPQTNRQSHYNPTLAEIQPFPLGTMEPIPGCPTGQTCGQWGNTDWSASGTGNYWQVNHPGRSEPASIATMSRYDLYMHEINNSFVADRSPGRPPSSGGGGGGGGGNGNGNGGGGSGGGGGGNTSFAGEVGAPGCYTGTQPKTASRRLIYGAIIDCNAYETSDPTKTTPVPVRAFGSFFLVSKMDQNGGNPNDDTVPNQALNLELVDITGPGGSGSLNNLLRPEVVLVR